MVGCRSQYALWKAECQKLFPVIGSGRFVTAPIINEEGEPIQDPLVLKEANFDNGSTIPARKSLGETSVSDGYASSPTNNSVNKKPLGIGGYGSIDKREIQWKLTLHQIGLFTLNSEHRKSLEALRSSQLVISLHSYDGANTDNT